MAKSTNPQHPLVRDGRSQIDRLDLQALAPDSVFLDDRSARQLLVYLNEFAKGVVFYETDGSSDKTIRQTNWQSFFKTSGPVQMSLIETFDVADYSSQYDATKQGFTEGLSRDQYAPWLDFLFDSALTVNGWFVALSSDIVLVDNQPVLNETPLRRVIQDLIQSNLQPALGQLFGVANLLGQAVKGKTTYQLPDLSRLEAEPLWNLDSIRYIQDTTLLNLSHSPIEQSRQIQDRLDDIFQTFSKTNRQIVETAAQPDILQTTRSTHEPHLALLYTFLQLLRPVINDFNGLTQKHLDFYYRDVLKLSPTSLVPDSAHAVFELPKPILQYRLPQEMLLKDGKDGHKVDVHFALDEEIIVSQTQVAELRTLFRDEDVLWAKPKANSVDGLGKDFADPLDAKWSILGSAGTEPAKAAIGLAIASKTLVLSSGIRTVTLTLTGKNMPSTLVSTTNPFPNDAFAVWLSGAKKWFTPKKAPTTELNLAQTALTITVELGIKEEAIVAADSAVLGVNYGLTDGQAVVQLLLKNDHGLYEDLRQFELNEVKIVADVSQVQDLLVRTDAGDQDPTKPFMPFGAVPAVGSAFSIGSPEIFAKPLKRLTIDAEWDKKPTDFNAYYKGYSLATAAIPANDDAFTRRVFYYANGLLVNEKADPGNVFKPLTLSDELPENNFHTGVIGAPAPLQPSITKEANWQDGFVLIELERDFLHQYYAEALTRKAMLLANKALETQVVSKTQVKDAEVEISKIKVPFTVPNADQSGQDAQQKAVRDQAIQIVDKLKTIPEDELTINPPYTPVIKSLTVSYKAEATQANLFYILPFDGETNFLATEANNALVYDFQEQGSLFIGLSNAVEGSLVPLLFQLLESSAKTNVKAAKIDWAYLNGNTWQNLTAGQYIVNDATNGFIQSGIVQVVLPERTSPVATTVLPPQYYWLKVSTLANIEAVCKAIGVHAQAVLTTFAPILADDPAKGNDPTRLAVPLPAGSITKLDTPDVNIKSVKQPYASFGGRPAENTTQYYRRVSEQLRHKGRGITLFDYEQIILDAFPEVFKVKCIPHTFANRMIDGAATFINDIHAAPGHVTVVVVPDTTRVQIDDLEKPMASRGLLSRIDSWMKARISPFVKLQVLNPIYQEVGTAFKVQFYPGRSPEFYKELLKKEIGRFLAPWAFDPTAQLTFGGVIYQSAILGFIENRDYVDFVTDFVMTINNVPQEEIQAPAARVIFTNGIHDITLFGQLPAPKVINKGIGYDWKLKPKPTS